MFDKHCFLGEIMFQIQKKNKFLSQIFNHSFAQHITNFLNIFYKSLNFAFFDTYYKYMFT